MKSRGRTAFSLLEVVLALGLFAFCGTTLLAMVSIALESAAQSSHETRAAQLAETVFTTLRQPGFETAECFGLMLNLATLATVATQDEPDDPPVRLHAAFPHDSPPILSPTPDPVATSHTLEFHFRPITGSGGEVIASCVTLRIHPWQRPDAALVFQSVIARL